MSLNDYSNNLFSYHLNGAEYEEFREDFKALKKKANYSHHVNNHKRIIYTQEEVENLLDRLCYFVVDYFKLKYKEKITGFEYIFPEQKSDSEIEKEKEIAEKEKIIEEQKNNSRNKVFIKKTEELKTNVLEAIELFGTNGWNITCGQIHKFLVDGYVKLCPIDFILLNLKYILLFRF